MSSFFTADVRVVFSETKSVFPPLVEIAQELYISSPRRLCPRDPLGEALDPLPVG
jgi:hypothetical protein